MNQEFLLRAFGVFLSGALIDAAWTYYIAHVSAGHKWRASLSSPFLVLANGLIVIEYVRDGRMLIISAAGGFLGAFVIMHFKRATK